MRYYKVVSFWEFLVFLFSFFLALFLLLFYFNGIWSSFTNKGVRAFEKKDFVQARKNFNLALTKRPFDPWTYINLGLTSDFLESPDKALKFYGIVSHHLSEKSNTAVFYSYFNQGELHGRLNQLEKALENYQQALEFRYKEKEIKTNIELLFQRDQQTQDKKGGGKEEKKFGEGQDPSTDEEKKSGDGQELSANEEEKLGEEQDPSANKTEPNLRNEQKQNKKQESSSKELSEKEQSAILEEIEKQENEARSRLYQRKKLFGDKSKKDW